MSSYISPSLLVCIVYPISVVDTTTVAVPSSHVIVHDILSPVASGIASIDVVIVFEVSSPTEFFPTTLIYISPSGTPSNVNVSVPVSVALLPASVRLFSSVP